jgi:AcrR family transcriptional regulator
MSYAPYHKQPTRKKIVRSAARLFNRRGFTEVTIGEIMTLAGFTHGGFYRHFNSKEELYAETVRHYREVAESMIQVFKANLKGRVAREQAMVLVALCVGGMVLARALDDQVLAHDFLGTARKHALKTMGWGKAGGQ